MKKDEVKVSSGLGFDDLCKFIEKCVSKKYQVDKTESFRVSTLSLYTGSFIITIRGLWLLSKPRSIYENHNFWTVIMKDPVHDFHA